MEDTTSLLIGEALILATLKVFPRMQERAIQQAEGKRMDASFQELT